MADYANERLEALKLEKALLGGGPSSEGTAK
jgi:hypothetical protein